ncbi:MAG: KilA-N domain-containing protein [Saprospiraceae bacterium]|nr:KilA-N domain-containing protein [Saprospiraceae bacterium]MCF8252157.1 KilA-N domain-containing protein [Saprospiraceae bacterium]MCF8282434.1 KilA-N domain-containing protein [Bacteroidales bacterium]MCF8313826.1 KilA-N domain-containing protein [Saprospiraceae bacterium]MCF8442532.1 KilA-N domain-containing protein [Saprospiraceae bacterium]
MANRKIIADGTEINLISQRNDEYISLTDMARKFNPVPNDVLKAWMRSSANIEFLGTWEIFHNEGFKTVAYNRFRFESTANAFIMTVKQWVGETAAIGIHATAGRYGGTYAHRDIAIQFANWLSPTFYLYVIKEFQRLKVEDDERNKLGWDWKRELAKVNYYLHTDAVRKNLVPIMDWNTKREAIQMASEADLLNLAMFGMTAKEWRAQHPEAKGNVRDQASPEQLVTLANLQTLNASYIEEGVSKEDRLQRLHQKAGYIMELLSAIPAMEDLKRLG